MRPTTLTSHTLTSFLRCTSASAFVMLAAITMIACNNNNDDNANNNDPRDGQAQPQRRANSFSSGQHRPDALLDRQQPDTNQAHGDAGQHEPAHRVAQHQQPERGRLHHLGLGERRPHGKVAARNRRHQS